MHPTELQKIGERIKYLREVLGLSPEAVAEQSKISLKDFLDAEAGKIDFTFNFLQRIAQCLGVNIVQLLTGESPKLTNYQINRVGEGLDLRRRESFEYLHLASFFKDKGAEPFLVTARYSEEEQNRPIPLATHNDQEFDFVIKGKLKVTVDNYTTVLNEGESIYYNANLPHGEIAYEGDCTFLAIVIKNSERLSEITTVEPPKISPAPTKDDGAVYHRFITPITDEKGRLTDIKFHPPENYNFAYDVVDAIAAKNPSKTAMVWLSHDGTTEKTFTFKDMAEYSNRAANFFISQGVKKGDRVMLVLKRRYEFWFAILALHKIGAIAVPATYLLTSKDYEYRFKSAGVTGVVVVSEEGIVSECEKAFENFPQIKTRISVGSKREGWVDFAEIANYSPEFARVDTHIDDYCLMYFTSGTTGFPKIAAHSSKYTLGHFVTAKYWHNVSPDGLHLTIADTGWGKSVWGKLYGQWLAEAPVFTYDFDKFKAADILPLFKKYNITTFCAPPTMYRFLLLEDLRKYDLSSLTYATTAGEALNKDVFDRFYEETGLKIMEGFGQTETTLMIANLVGSDVRLGSMGKPTPQYPVEIVNAEGKRTKDGEVGEIVIRTDNGIPYGLFCGYYLDEAATYRANHDGLYHTGDMAWRDEDGYYWYMSRIDDVIKSSGYRIGPFEIESVLMELPYIVECAITGVPDLTRGQIVKATIVLKEGAAPTEELKKEIQKYVKTHTAPYKYPRVIEFVKELPRTTNGKIRRKALRDGEKE